MASGTSSIFLPLILVGEGGNNRWQRRLISCSAVVVCSMLMPCVFLTLSAWEGGRIRPEDVHGWLFAAVGPETCAIALKN